MNIKEIINSNKRDIEDNLKMNETYYPKDKYNITNKEWIKIAIKAKEQDFTYLYSTRYRPCKHCPNTCACSACEHLEDGLKGEYWYDLVMVKNLIIPVNTLANLCNVKSKEIENSIQNKKPRK